MSPCSINAVCIDTHGSYTCSCNAGYRENGFTCESNTIHSITLIRSQIFNFVVDINECDSIHPCNGNANCTDTLGSFICTCNSGFTGDGLTCQSIIIFTFSYIVISCLNLS